MRAGATESLSGGFASRTSRPISSGPARSGCLPRGTATFTTRRWRAWKASGSDQPDETETFFDSRRLTIRHVLWNELLHHLIHHRAQLVLLCRMAGGTPPGFDGPNREEMQALQSKAATVEA